MRATTWNPVALLLAGCNLFVTPAPAVVRRDVPVDCTDTYWLPAADAVASAALLGYSAWAAHKYEDGCDRGDPDWCDPQSGIAVAIPLVAGIGLAVTAEVGRRRVSRCRRAHAWQREVAAGRAGPGPFEVARP